MNGKPKQNVTKLPKAFDNVVATIDCLGLLVQQIGDIVGENNGIDVSLARDLESLNIEIHMPLSSEYQKAIYQLESATVMGHKFVKVSYKVPAHAAHRRIVTAQLRKKDEQ